MNELPCRFCGAHLEHTFIDLGKSPLCESFLSAGQLNQMEPFYPLHVFVCDHCFLVQLEEFVSPEEIFRDYAYFSSYARSWRQHVERFVERFADALALGGDSLVVELASNDGCLLEHFVKRGIPALGVEPARNVAVAAEQRGVETVTEFFGVALADALVAVRGCADLIVANNVLAQVTDLNDFVSGMNRLLRPGGTITVEFPHLLSLMEKNQFDTIYHEHFSYFSFMTAERIFAHHRLVVFDVEEIWTHGGSLRLHCGHRDALPKPVQPAVARLRARERETGLDDRATYDAFGERVRDTKNQLLQFLIDARSHGEKVVGYGAPGKGNTLLNYCGIGPEYLDFTVDLNPNKHGKYLPGTHIPIQSPDAIDRARPDYVLILPWNFKDEIVEQMAHIRDWGGRFVVPIPELEVIQ